MAIGLSYNFSKPRPKSIIFSVYAILILKNDTPFQQTGIGFLLGVAEE